MPSPAVWSRRHPVASYVVFAYVLTWLAVLPLATEGAGITRRLVSPFLHVLGAVGPVAAGFAVTALAGGRTRVAELWRDVSRWRVGAGWWLIAAGTPLLFGGVAVGLLAAIGDPSLDFAGLSHSLIDPRWLLVQLVASLAYGIGEEPGWRGFLLPRLQARRSALTATLLLSVIWAAWHAPMFFYRFALDGAGAYAGFFVSLAAGAIWLTFLYNSTGGSVLITIVWHTIWNGVSMVGLAISPNVAAVASGCVIAAAVIALIAGRPSRLSRWEKHVGTSGAPSFA